MLDGAHMTASMLRQKNLTSLSLQFSVRLGWRRAQCSVRVTANTWKWPGWNIAVTWTKRNSP